MVSFDTDWRFDTAHSREIVQMLAAHRVPVSFREIASPHGHDSFLLVVPEYHRTVANFLQRVDTAPMFSDAAGIRCGWISASSPTWSRPVRGSWTSGAATARCSRS